MKIILAIAALFVLMGCDVHRTLTNSEIIEAIKACKDAGLKTKEISNVYGETVTIQCTSEEHK